MKFQLNDRVSLSKDALSLSYVISRHWYTDVYEGKTGRVIGFSETKVAVEFDELVFTGYKEKRSSHDNGCHGKGKLHYCWYFPENCLVSEIVSDVLLLLKG